MDTRHTVRGYSETASALSDETDAVERERLQDIEMAERRKREAQAMEMAKIDAQLEAEEQKIQSQMDMEKARLAQDRNWQNNKWQRMHADTNFGTIGGNP